MGVELRKHHAFGLPSEDRGTLPSALWLTVQHLSRRSPAVCLEIMFVDVEAFSQGFDVFVSLHVEVVSLLFH